MSGRTSKEVAALLLAIRAELRRLRDPEKAAPMRAYMKSAILFQLKLKEEIDVALLFDCIRPSMEEQEFFLRKAIGWALREYAKTDPKEVLRFVRRHDAELSGLSKREALKHLGSDRPFAGCYR